MIRADQIDIEDLKSTLNVVEKIKLNGYVLDADPEDKCIYIDVPVVVSTPGDNISTVMSQKAVTEFVVKSLKEAGTIKKIALNGTELEIDTDKCVNIEIPKMELVQDSGDSEEDVMSQKAVTDFVMRYVDEVLSTASLPELIESFTTSKTLFKKGTTVESIELKWTLSREPSSIKINEIEISDLNSTSYTFSNLSDKTTYTLVVTDKFGSSTKTLTVNFVYPIYTGVGGENISSISELQSLDEVLKPSRSHNFTENADEGQYIYFVLPHAYCIPTAPTFSSGGFVGGFKKISDNNFEVELEDGTRPFYDVYRSDEPSLGTTTINVS